MKDDSISRKKALDTVRTMYDRCDTGDMRDYRDLMSEAIEALPSAEPGWIPCSERLPEEDHWLGGSGRQFSDEVLVSVANYDDEDIWTYISQTIDGEWMLELPRHCKIVAWMPLPEPWEGDHHEG